MMTYYTTHLKDSLTNIDTNITTQEELEELAVTLCDKLMKAVDTSTPEVYSRNDPKSLISQTILDLITEKLGGCTITHRILKPRSNDPNFLPNNTQHLCIICCMLLHVVVLDSGQTHQTFCATLHNFIIFCGLSD